MAAPVFAPRCGVNAANLEDFRAAVEDTCDGQPAIVVDCSSLDFMTVAAMRVLENASRRIDVTLINPTPVVRLLASVFGVDIEEPDDLEIVDELQARRVRRGLVY